MTYSEIHMFLHEVCLQNWQIQSMTWTTYAYIDREMTKIIRRMINEKFNLDGDRSSVSRDIEFHT